MTKKSKKQIENQAQAGYMQSNEPQIAGGKAGKQNRSKTRSQEGRSMVEMLGVLAVIAVVSIGGIVGYKLAMNYYQADQIANEINLMRNDLKVKYALGNEELLLGDPYDDTPENEHYSGHLSTQYDRYPVDYDCIRKDKAEFYNCRETDAYYIKIANVSKGVCKPLATLLNGMDGLMYMEINKQPYKEDDLCSSDEVNEFYIQFDAEEVNGNYDSNRPEGWCADDEDCPDEKPFCENERCVECTPETGCESNTQHCENNECISCPGGKIWSGTACVDCMTDIDCADPDTPICKTDEHICVECKTDEDCLTKGTENPICNTDTNTCEPCPPEKPIWYNNACVECTVNEDCLEKATEKPICNSDTYTCEACPEDQPWNGEFCGCRDNDDCTSDKFCISVNCERLCTDRHQSIRVTENCDIKKCVSISSYTQQNQDSTDSYVISSREMNWWSAKRFCEAQEHKKNMLRISELECQNTIGYHDGLEGLEERGQCMSRENPNEVSHIIKALRKARFGNETQTADEWYWLKDAYAENRESEDSCNVYQVHLNGTIFYGDFRFNSGYALCES